MSRLFFTSDWHLGHQRIIELDKRPFASLDEMHDSLIRRYNSVVTPYAVCYFLGDMGFMPTSEMFKIISALNGTKVLVLGNHDKGTERFYKAGFHVVCNSVTLFHGQTRLTLSHMPLRGVYRENCTGMGGAAPGDNWHGESRPSSLDYSLPAHDGFHLHGHIHSPNGGRSFRTLGRQMDVGVAANNYTPVSMSQVASWIAAVSD